MAIPTTLPLSMSTIKTELGLGGSQSLTACFAAATGTFNATYSGAKDRVSNFRGYNHTCNTSTSLNLYPSSGQASSGSGTCPSGGSEVPHYFHPAVANVVSGSSTVTTDLGGCNVFNGGGLWYRVRSNGGEASTFYSVRISSLGAVIGKIACT